MSEDYLEKKVRKTWIFQNKFPLLIFIAVIAIIVISFSLSFPKSTENHHGNTDFVYNTWKVEKVYKNGKLVINNSKYNNLFLQLHKDGTAEWISEDKTLSMDFRISPDGSQIIFDDGIRIEDVETIFELRPTLLRFGKKSINSHYEYVLTADDIHPGANFF